MFANSEGKQQWRVLYTRPRAEKRAFDSLSKKGYHVYVPYIKVIRQWSDRKKKVEVPMFNSYLFVFCKPCEIELASREEHIVKVVRFGGQPAVVREKEMDMIRKVEAGEEDVMVTYQRIVAGQRVKIKQGRLRGLTGILTEFRGTHKVSIEIESLGCNLLVEVQAGNIEEVK